MITMHKKLALISCWLVLLVGVIQAENKSERPNVLILFLDDLDPDFGCYGNTLVSTPNIDRLSEEGMRFTHAFAAGTVCSPSHTSLFTGCYSSTISCPHHRSTYIDKLPAGYTILTELMAEAGYFTVNFKSNGDYMYNKVYGATAKTDLNFDRGKPENNQESGKEVFDNLHIIDPTNISTYFKGGAWNNKQTDQPFFAYANIETGKKHGFEPGRKWAKEHGIAVDSTKVSVPLFYSDTPEIRQVLASALDAVSHTDVEVGKFLVALDQAGLKENTLVILASDHGATLPRHKQCLWYTGIHVPMIIRWPGKVDANSINTELASIIDIAPTILKATKNDIPRTMQGINLLGNDLKKRDCIFATRDGMNNYFDCSRAVITKDFHYIRHFYPELPFRGNHYASKVLTFPRMLELYENGELNDVQSIYFDSEKAKEELYQLQKEECQVVNLAENPGFEKTLKQFRNKLEKWQKESGDVVLDAREILKMDKVPEGTMVDELLHKQNQ